MCVSSCVCVCFFLSKKRCHHPVSILIEIIRYHRSAASRRFPSRSGPLAVAAASLNKQTKFCFDCDLFLKAFTLGTSEFAAAESPNRRSHCGCCGLKSVFKVFSKKKVFKLYSGFRIGCLFVILILSHHTISLARSLIRRRISSPSLSLFFLYSPLALWLECFPQNCHCSLKNAAAEADDFPVNSPPKKSSFVVYFFQIDFSEFKYSANDVFVCPIATAWAKSAFWTAFFVRSPIADRHVSKSSPPALEGRQKARPTPKKTNHCRHRIAPIYLIIKR